MLVNNESWIKTLDLSPVLLGLRGLFFSVKKKYSAYVILLIFLRDLKRGMEGVSVLSLPLGYIGNNNTEAKELSPIQEPNQS